MTPFNSVIFTARPHCSQCRRLYWLDHFCPSDRLSVHHVRFGCWSGVVVSALASINEVNLRRARLVLRWATVSGFNSRCQTFIWVCNQPATQGQLTLNDLERQNGRAVCVISPNSLAFATYYVKVVKDKPILPASETWPKESSF